MNIYSVYEVTDEFNETYVGVTVDPINRIKKHISSSNRGTHKYLFGQATGKILLHCERKNTSFYERLCIKHFSNVPQSTGGEGVRPKGPRSEATKKLLSEIGKTKTGTNSSAYGMKHSEETKKRLSEIGKTKTGINHNSYGYKHSEESRAKMRLARSKYKQSRETILKGILTRQTNIAIRKEKACEIL